MITIIPTPIGNLADITLRALDVLKTVDGIICEDTRRTSILLNHYEIKKPLLVLNDFNEVFEFPKILQKLIEGQNLALVSDAGTPLISDPGYKLIREAKRLEIEVDSLPGPTSITTALTLSGLPPDKFLFLGYLPEKSGARLAILQKIKDIFIIFNLTAIIFVAPFKLIKTLEDLVIKFGGDFKITLATELSKIHQSVESKTISEWLETFSKTPPKGEYIILISPTSS